MSPVTVAPLSIYGDVDPREVPFYTVKQAAGYLRVPASTVRAWTMGQDYPTARGLARFRRLIKLHEGRPARLTFNNLIEAYVLTTMRRVHQVDLGTVRCAIANVKKQLGDERPLLSRDFVTDGVRIYLDTIDGLLEVSSESGRQLVLPEVNLSLQRIERDAQGIADRLFPFASKANEPRVISIDPCRSFGKPTIEGSGVQVTVIVDLLNAGETRARVANEFGITVDAVRQAAAWHALAAA